MNLIVQLLYLILECIIDPVEDMIVVHKLQNIENNGGLDNLKH